jgi:hypothetical protein
MPNQYEFDNPKQEAIAELHLVTWGPMQMVGHLDHLTELLPNTPIIQRLPGLQNFYIEIKERRLRKVYAGGAQLSSINSVGLERLSLT